MVKKRKGRDISGILLLDKSTGISSNQALQNIKRLFNAAKAGHTGSLDPLATGLLPVFFGEATKFSQFLLDADKTYLAGVKLGQKTETGDAEGKVIQERPVDFAFEVLVEILSSFTGPQKQVPSMYSALKHQGQPLYKLARQGVEIEREPRDIFIYGLELLSDRKLFEQEGEIELRVHCSKGTYIRNLVEDIGESAGCGAHLVRLRRTQSGPFTSMVCESELRKVLDEQGQEGGDKLILPVDKALEMFPPVFLEDKQVLDLKQGRIVESVANPEQVEGLVRIYGTGGESRAAHIGDFLGLGDIARDNSLKAKRLLRTN